MIIDKPYFTSSLEQTLETRLQAEEQERLALAAMRPQVVDPRLEETIDIELLAVQRMLDFSRFKRLMSITPKEFGQLSQVEKRLLLRAASGFQKRFDELVNWMSRNSPVEPELPAQLQAKG